MATSIVNAPITLDGDADDESGHRTYRVLFRIKSNDPKFDGPATVMQTPGLPLPGSIWAFGNDLDVYAWCRPGMRVRRARGVIDRGPVRYYDVERTFSTKPAALSGGTSSGRPGSSGGGQSGNRQGCHDGRVEDPLLEPQGVSGSFVKRSDFKAYDVYGDPITNSAWESFTAEQLGQQVSNPTVSVEQNVPALQLSLVVPMLDTLNDDVLWGLPARVWMLTNFDWERKFYGMCYPYYVRRFTFEANYRLVVDNLTGTVVLQPAWDRTLQDVGTKALKGHWGTGRDTPDTAGTAGEGTGWVLESVDDVVLTEPDPSDPTHFTRYRDRSGDFGQVVLNGMGVPYDPNDAARSFHWVYLTGDTPNVHEGTYNSAHALSSNDPDVTGHADVYGPFYTAAQATTASTDADLFTSSRYRGWSGPSAFPSPGKIKPTALSTSNFLLLGIPTIL